MAKTVVIAAYLSLAAADWSDRINSAELAVQMEEKDVTTFGSGGAKEVLGGLESGTLKIKWKNDFADSGVDDVMWAHMKTRTPIAFEVRPSNAAASANNPKYTGYVLVNSWTPIGAAVGDPAEVETSWPLSGATTRAEA